MTLEARAWLPAAAIADGTLAAALGQGARAWATRWFVEGRAPKITPCPTAVSAPKDTFWLANAGLFLAIDPQKLGNLGRALMRVENGLQKLTPADLQLFRDLGANCFEDFLHCASEAFFLAPRDALAESPDAHFQGLRFSISIAGIAFELYVDGATAIATRKAMLPEAPARRDLFPREQAIRAQSVKLGAMIGTSKIKLAEYYALEVGDVVVLDRGVDDEVSLTVDGVTSTSLAGAIFSEDADLKVRITQLEGIP